jgi:uncharacterized membrane protein
MVKTEAKKKPALRLTKAEALAELAVLSETVEFDQEYSEETKLDVLRELVRDGREAAAEPDAPELGGEEPEADEEEEKADVDDDEEATPAPAVTASEAPKGPGAHVFDGNGRYVRTYTPKLHGKDFAKVAKQFCAKKGREKFQIRVAK